MDVVVVGAGIAGISAARKLTNHPGVNVTVLEARPDRYGGRIWTNKKAWPNATGAEVEMGASWIHGMSPQNPITELQTQINLEVFTTDYNNISLYSYTDGKQFRQKAVDNAYHDFKQTLMDIHRVSIDSDDDTSFEEAIIKDGRTQWLNSPLIQYFICSKVEAMEGAPSTKISSQTYDPSLEYKEGFSGPDALIINGYSKIIDCLVDGRGTSEKPLDIRLNKEVVSVSVNASSKTVTVWSRDGESFVCDAVVVAVPLGVLKAGVITFSPSLPPETREAIENIGFGNLNKLILEFDAVFWPMDTHIIGMASDDASERGFLWVWYNMCPVLKRPVLMGFLAGDAAYRSENLTQQELVEKALQMFEKIFGGSMVRSRQVVNALRTRWHADRFTQGAYSYDAVGNTEALRHAFTSETCRHVYFAGEHTATGYIANVHGAYMSGENVAEKILHSMPRRRENSS